MSQAEDAVSYVTRTGLEVRRQQPVIGAEILGVDLTAPVSPQVAEDIRQVLWAHGVIFFRDQPIDYDGHLRLAALFGEPMPEIGLDAARPTLTTLKTESGGRSEAGAHWHSDGDWAAVPPALTILRCVTAPALGGQTFFCSATAAYQGLPDDVKHRIAHLQARSSLAEATRHVDPNRIRAMLEAYPPADHPIVRVHPVTGALALYVNEGHTQKILGIEAEEGRELLHCLLHQFTRPEYQMAWTWRDDSIAVWDNAAVQHYAVPGQIGFRHMERIRTAGAAPYGIDEAGLARRHTHSVTS